MMGNNVFANGRSISCKAGSGAVTAAFPDVCLSPPGPPAGPVPLPYPLSSASSDMTGGSKKVEIAGKEVMLRDKSYFKKCSGDEAATKSFGQGVITHQLSGKVYFASWSMDVLVEGQNVVRHLDMTTSNHASQPGNESVPMVQVESMTVSSQGQANCPEVLTRFPVESYGEQRKKSEGVYKGAQSHHVMMNAHFQQPRGVTVVNCPGYTEDAAPCIPLEDGTDPSTAHGRASRMQMSRTSFYKQRYEQHGTNVTYAEARQDAVDQLTDPSPGPGLTREEAECILIEVDKKFAQMCGGTGDLVLRPPRTSGWKPPTDFPSTDSIGAL